MTGWSVRATDAQYFRGLSRAEPTDAAPSDRSLGAVEAMARFAAENYRQPVGTAEIARAAHLHPNYAMTLFRRRTGLTLLGYLTLQRVAHAQRRLLTTDDAVHTIALESGFGSIGRFYDAFKKQTGSSPRRFRESALRGSPSRPS